MPAVMNLPSFLEAYTGVYNQQDARNAVGFYHLPVVIISDDSKQVFADEGELKQDLGQWMRRLNSSGLVAFESTLQQVMNLSEQIRFASVKWRFMDREGNMAFECFNSYTLQQNADTGFKIIVSVLDDERQKLACYEQEKRLK